MTCHLVLNWKTVLALGAPVMGFVLARKLSPAQAEAVLNKLFDTTKAVITGNSDD